MTAEAVRLTEEALKLSKEERLHLLTVLADSIEEGSLEEIEAAWVTEAKRRLAGIESGDPVADEGVHARISATQDAELLQVWIERASTAESLAEVFDD